MSFSKTHKINKTCNEEIKGTRTDLESRADLVAWNLIQSSWGKGRRRLWNKQVSQKSNEDWKQHIPNQHREWTAFTSETSLCTCMVNTGGLLASCSYTLYSCISVGMMPGWRYQATLSSPSNAIRRKSTLIGHCRWELSSSTHTHTHVQWGGRAVQCEPGPSRLTVTWEITRGGGGISQLVSSLTPPTH